VLAAPGQRLGTALLPGDLLVRRAIGDGAIGHVALIAVPDVAPRDRALAQGWSLEGPRRGGYVRVVEAAPGRYLVRDDRFARRLLDPAGRLPTDTVVLRLRPGAVPALEAAEQAGPAKVQGPPAPAPAPPVPAGPDSTVADSFVAADASRWCTPGDKRSATCRGIATPRPIRRVVVHTLAVPSTRRRTGAQAVVLGWQRPGRVASAHYIIDRDGTTTQMVREANVAFHAGAVNRDSIGIEHADVCNDPAPFTRELYERSAALVRDIARRHGFPLSVFGVDTAALASATVSGHEHHSGPGGHGDPGPYWDWRYYALLLHWDGVTGRSRPLRETWTVTSPVTARPAGWTEDTRRTIADSRCASSSDPYGPSYWRARPDPAGAPVVFTLPVPARGVYQLSLWWPRVKNGNPATPVEIDTGAGAAAFTVDQSRGAGRWTDVGGEFAVTSARATVTVRILRTSRVPGTIVADGVRLLRLRAAP